MHSTLFPPFHVQGVLQSPMEPPHINQHTGMGMAEKIQTFGFYSTFPCFPAYPHGRKPLLLKERLGHEKIQTTLGTYGHLYPNTNLEVAKKLTGVLNIREQSERHPQPAHGEVPFSKWKSGIETRKGCPPHHGRTPKSIMRNALRP